MQARVYRESRDRIKLAGAPRESELPRRDAKGNRPAIETARALKLYQALDEGKSATDKRSKRKDK
jgi:hypothetical protein